MEILKFILGAIVGIVAGIFLAIYSGLEMLEKYFKKQKVPGAQVVRVAIHIISIPFGILVNLFESLHSH